MISMLDCCFKLICRCVSICFVGGFVQVSAWFASGFIVLVVLQICKSFGVSLMWFQTKQNLGCSRQSKWFAAGTTVNISTGNIWLKLRLGWKPLATPPSWKLFKSQIKPEKNKLKSPTYGHGSKRQPWGPQVFLIVPFTNRFFRGSRYLDPQPQFATPTPCSSTNEAYFKWGLDQHRFFFLDGKHAATAQSLSKRDVIRLGDAPKTNSTPFTSWPDLRFLGCFPFACF